MAKKNTPVKSSKRKVKNQVSSDSFPSRDEMIAFIESGIESGLALELDDFDKRYKSSQYPKAFAEKIVADLTHKGMPSYETKWRGKRTTVYQSNFYLWGFEDALKEIHPTSYYFKLLTKSQAFELLRGYIDGKLLQYAKRMLDNPSVQKRVNKKQSDDPSATQRMLIIRAMAEVYGLPIYVSGINQLKDVNDFYSLVFGCEFEAIKRGNRESGLIAKNEEVKTENGAIARKELIKACREITGKLNDKKLTSWFDDLLKRQPPIKSRRSA